MYSFYSSSILQPQYGQNIFLLLHRTPRKCLQNGHLIFISTTASAVPMTINGIRRPFLSLSAPKSGSRNSASILSIPIIMPRNLLSSPLIMMKVAVTTDAAGNANYTALFASVAGLMVTAIAILVLTIREKKLVAEMKAINYGVSEDEDQGKTETVNGKEKLPKPVLKSLLLILTTIGLWFLGYNAVTTFFTSYATATWSGGLSHASTCLMVATVAAVASYIPIGMISAKIGRRNMIRIGLLTAAAGFAVATFCAREFSFYLYIVFAVVGFAQASVTVNTFPMVWEISRSGNVGKYTGLYYTVSMTAQTVTPFLVGIFLDKLGNDALFPYGLVFVLLALIPISLAKHGDNRPEAPKSKLEAFDVDD